jgi:hypothetical protein
MGVASFIVVLSVIILNVVKLSVVAPFIIVIVVSVK